MGLDKVDRPTVWDARMAGWSRWAWKILDQWLDTVGGELQQKHQEAREAREESEINAGRAGGHRAR